MQEVESFPSQRLFYNTSTRTRLDTNPLSHLKAKGFSSSDTSSSPNSLEDKRRGQSIENLQQWAKRVGIQTKDVQITSGSPILGGGLGILTTRSIAPNSVMLQVPTHLTFSVSNSKIDSNRESESYFRNNAKAYRDAPWWAKLSIDLYICDNINSKRSGASSGDETVDMRPWLDSLPRKFDTPIRWSKSDLEELQYPPLVSMVAAQEKSYRAIYETLKMDIEPSSSLSKWTYEDFLWGADCARSRAFSGAYGGSAFDPKPYALTLILVLAYVGLHLGTMEQASNGAALVLCASIFRDFVLPKLFKTKKYVICPYIDMANHAGMKEEANVAFEYFSNGYSLSSRTDSTLDKGTEVRISYGPRSNDALLQQYGFVEPNNAHDVYVMPPLREWDISSLEKACGRKIQPGRLQKLDRAGLLGGSSVGSGELDDNEFVEGVSNRGRGVVLTRASGLDPAIMTALRVLVSTDAEWETVGEAVGNMTTENSGGIENERMAKIAAQTALGMELNRKATTLEQDEERLKNRSSLGLTTNQILALQFRIEKKKLLNESIFALTL